MTATAISASAAIAAACITLYIGLVRPRLRNPKLALLTQYEDPHCITHITKEDGWQGVWARLRVHNPAGCDTAEDVKVMIVDVRPHGDPKNDPLAPIPGRLLKWANHDANSMQIPPGISVRCDILQFTYEPKVNKVSRRLCIYPLSAIRSLNDHEFPEGRFRMLVALCSKNVSARFYRIDCAYDVGWNGSNTPSISLTARRITGRRRHILR